MTSLPVSPIDGLTTVELTTDRAPLLQRFLLANPEYFHIVSGAPPGPDEALEEINGAVPAGWAMTKKWVVGYQRADGELAAMVNLITDLLAPGVFHIGLFVVATARHGSGDAQRLYDGIERWSIDDGARWMRLGVVEGNARAERFWASRGFTTIRRRHDVVMGQRSVTILTMFKPLAGDDVEQYLLLVPRDDVRLP